MKIPANIDKVLRRVEKKAKPVSIFIYGSRARKDFKENSDFEVGILFKSDEKWRRRKLKKLHTISGLNLYPFVYEKFLQYNLDAPFPKAVYLKELIEGGKTVRGKKIIENMEPPEIRLLDLQEVTIFQTAMAYTAVKSSQQNDWITASIGFAKSVLFGTRVLIIVKEKKFPLTYNEIAKKATVLNLDKEYQELIKHALKVRAGTKPEVNMLYANISFLNQTVLPQIKKMLLKGNSIVLEGKRINE